MLNSRLIGGHVPSPVSEEHEATTGVQDDGPRTIHTRDVNHLSAVQIHCVDAAVGRIGPVDFLVGPIVSDTFRIDGTSLDQEIRASGRI